MTTAIIPTTNWPKQYLLKIHEEAVNHGFIWIEGISAANAEGLRQRLYRIRRRSDKSTATFILPEYHLVTIGDWEQHGPNPTLGRIPAIYNRLPDGSALPTLRPATADEIEATIAAASPVLDMEGSSPATTTKKPFELPPDLSLEMKPADIGDFVASMKAAAAAKSKDS